MNPRQGPLRSFIFPSPIPIQMRRLSILSQSARIMSLSLTSSTKVGGRAVHVYNYVRTRNAIMRGRAYVRFNSTLQTLKDAGPKSISDPTWRPFSRRYPRALRWSCLRQLGRGMLMQFCRTSTQMGNSSTTACTSNILRSLAPGPGSRTWAS